MAGELGFDTGPFVNAAAFCESVIEGKDGVLTLVRVIDQFKVETQGPEAPDEMPPNIIISPNLVVILRAGQARGSLAFQVVIENPDGTRVASPERSIQFPGGGENAGINIVVPMRLMLTSAGVYWGDVMVNHRLMTRVPLLVTYGFTRGPGVLPPTS